MFSRKTKKGRTFYEGKNYIGKIMEVSRYGGA